MNAKALVALMRDGASLTCLGEYAIETDDTVVGVHSRTVQAAIKSGRIEQVCNNGSPILKFQLTLAQEENER